MNQGKFTFLGTGTSQGVPLIGCICPVCTSSDPRNKRLRSAGYIVTPEVKLNIDIGTDFRQQMLRAELNDTDGVLITHEHIDHINGIDDLRPINQLQDKVIPLYAEARVLEQIRERYNYIFEKSRYPGLPKIRLVPISPGDTLMLGDLEIEVLRVYHGDLPILGFKMGDLTYLTDVKRVPQETIDKINLSETLITSALHKRTHHSHMNLQESLAFVEGLTPKQVYLIHCSHQMGTYEEVSTELPPRVELAYDGLELIFQY
ncbi:MAG TPA: MBL fold metallo-hydrolase [Saprospiraceae bacterium]|nr:MBL fold metallo-hydrolase [Saprospiraceae bacterium]HQW56553.1 MBL fold metallo-hydrolase [Saprospiraceae bacterium]